MSKFDLGINLAKEVSASIRIGGKNLLQTRPIGKINIEGLRYAPQEIGDTYKISNSILNEFTNYARKFAQQGEEFIPAFKTQNSALAKYLHYLEDLNKQRVLLRKAAESKTTFKIQFRPQKAISGNWDLSADAKIKDLTNYKNFLFDNAEKYNISKAEYQQIADEVAKLNKEYISAQPGIRQEIKDNIDKITHWNDIFHTQCQNWSTINKHKFYDEKEFMQAVEEYKNFVESVSGKKVLIPTPSRMGLASSFIGVLNNPANYKEYDYFLISHGRGSSLIQNLNHPDAWRFSDDQSVKVWDYIEKNVPKGKRVLVASCEQNGVKLAGKKAEEMTDKLGVKMIGIGEEVLGSGIAGQDGPLKICESGIRHIIGHANSSIHANCIYLRTSCGNEYIPISKDAVRSVYYDLDFSKYRI